MTSTAPSRDRGAPDGSAARRAVGAHRDLRSRIAADLRQRLRDGEWASGEQLPTETDLLAEYGVSRSTVRGALQQLESQGLTMTRHGLGTFVTPFGHAIKTGLQELQSMSDTIAAHGMTPRMDYHHAQLRDATAEERAALSRPEPCRVLATARAVYADEVLVAFSYETIPADLLPESITPDSVRGSLFAMLAECGSEPRTAVAEVHAVRGGDIGWGERPREASYLLLGQVHYDENATPIMMSRTYFIEGRFEFSILRVR